MCNLDAKGPEAPPWIATDKISWIKKSDSVVGTKLCN